MTHLMEHSPCDRSRTCDQRIPLGAVLCLILFFGCGRPPQPPPHLEPIGDRLQLVVDGKPFLMLGGELGNSTATTMASMAPVWPRMKALSVNTVLLPIYWELFEPQEGVFDDALVEALILEARRHDLKLVILWFGVWKNSMSSHVPAWVKLDQDRFPRAKSEAGISQEILTPFSEEVLQADLKAYVRLLDRIREIDAAHQTVILMQIENEIGMLPSARDHSPQAEAAFRADVPQDLIDHLTANRERLNPEFREVWAANGYKTSGTWEDVFGVGLHTDEIFMAWAYGRFVDRLSAAGKAVYPLPTFVNAALPRPGRKPGEYPSAGPLPHIMDVWMAASHWVDFYSPDFYNPDFQLWNDLYVRQGNPLFIPEHNFDETVAAKALFAFGRYEALGFAPFSIEQNPEEPMRPKELKLADVYKAVAEVKPLLDAHRGQGRVQAVLLERGTERATFELGGYEFTATHTYNFGWEPGSRSETWEPAAALVVRTGEREFHYVGFGVSLTFRKIGEPETLVGILKTDRGRFENGRWVVWRHLNGDQTHQGRHIRSFVDDVSIQRFELYDYR